MEYDKKCPICGSTEIGEGKQTGEGIMVPLEGFFKTGSEVLADICTDCGHILSMRVKNPKKFKP